MKRWGWLWCAGVVTVTGACQDDGSSRAGDAGAGDHDAAPGTQADAGGADVSASMHALGSSGTHGCALRKSGLYCWGENFLGQLGDGTTIDSATPVKASMAGTDIVDVAVATGRTCVRRSSGQVACWGANEAGQVGDGTRNDALAAVDVPGVADALQLTVATRSTCVVRKDASVSCWGNAPASSSAGSLEPITMPGLGQVAQLVTAGIEGYCALASDGAVRCFRFENEAWTQPTEVVDLKGARAIAMSNTQVLCGAMPAAGLRCHEIESGKTFPLTDSADYVKLSGLNLVVCGLQLSGKGRCWNVIPEIVFDIPSAVPLKEIAISGLTACVLGDDGSVMCASAGNAFPIPVLEPVTLPE